MRIEQTNFVHNLDWNLLKTYAEIVRAGGVSRAALEWNRKQPAVSLALKRLEERVGARLCDRGPGGFRLTDEGKRLADFVSRLSGLVGALPDRLERDGGPVGCLRMQVISNLVDRRLDALIAEFHRRHPAVSLELEVVTWERVTRALLVDDIDVGVAPAHNRRAELRYDLLFREVHRAYCGREHALFGEHIADADALADHAFILTGADEPDELTGYRMRYGLGRRVAGKSEHLEEAKRLAMLGIGICFLPVGYAAEEVEGGKLWPLTATCDAPAMNIFLITNPATVRPGTVRCFLDTLETVHPMRVA